MPADGGTVVKHPRANFLKGAIACAKDNSTGMFVPECFVCSDRQCDGRPIHPDTRSVFGCGQ